MLKAGLLSGGLSNTNYRSSWLANAAARPHQAVLMRLDLTRACAASQMRVHAAAQSAVASQPAAIESVKPVAPRMVVNDRPRQAVTRAPYRLRTNVRF